MFYRGKIVLFFAAKWLKARVQLPGLRPQEQHPKLQKCRASIMAEAVTCHPRASPSTTAMPT